MQWIGEVGTPRKSAKDRYMYVRHLVGNEFLPQMGLDYSPDTLARKSAFFAFMLWRLSQVTRGLQPPTTGTTPGTSSTTCVAP